ncbi:hypothetical protein NDU88_006823 [Pleurodeles waltl]|uniref:Uncharacterized protein n=1 Tax=Pleurodeles waltl TaxID=8319 RepID=A0AAV7LQS0_PLEWA|nr:hypothetical protein NDU88_006823 [Pleurodeles waltl]
MPRQDAQGTTPWPRLSSTHPPAHGPPSQAAVRSGGRGAPAAAPQLESSQFRRAAAQTPQPQLRSDFMGESDGAAPMPRVRHTHLSEASLFFRLGSPAAPRSVSLDGPARNQLPRVQASRGHPRVGGGSLHVAVPTRDKDKRPKGGP